MKVSIIIPVYNTAPFLDRSIQSALDQRQTGEVLLIDDRSTDGSWEICEAWVTKNKKVRLFKNDGIKGAGAARNVGLQNATFEYIAFLDADDYYMDGRFNEDNQVFSHNCDLSATSNTIIINTIKAQKHTGLNAIFENNKKIGSQKSFSTVSIYDFHQGGTFHLNGLTLKKSVLNKISNFDEGLKQAQDTDFLFRILLTGLVSSTDVSKAKAVYNIHSENTISNIPEAVYYRRKAAKKHFHLAIEHKLKLSLILKFFINFVEYEYLWFWGRSNKLKKFYKVAMLPFFIYRIFSKNDPEYDKDRKILLS